MSGKISFLAALLVALSAWNIGWSQDQQGFEGEQVTREPDAAHGPPPAIVPSSGLSDWITYRRDLCCLAPVAGPSRMRTEFFFRTGVSAPIGETVGHLVGAGWNIAGGARFMLYDTGGAAAWALDIGLSNHNNRGDAIDQHFPLRRAVAGDIVPILNQRGPDRFISIGSALRALNRTFLNVGLGREWYLWGTCETPQQWRVGVDGGGRYGTAKADFFYFPDEANPVPEDGLIIRQPHRVDVIGGAYAAFHTDVEFPRGCCTYLGGLRGEWAYTWSDILQKQSDLSEVSLIVNLGVRY